MVTAGVYMIARSSQTSSLHARWRWISSRIIGLATAFFAATIGLAQNDIKKVFAYSTVSQLGYMFLGLGTGAFSAGIFHLMTHAFFKALLFLGAGSVIHALSRRTGSAEDGRPAQEDPRSPSLTLFCAGWPSRACRRSPASIARTRSSLAAYHHAPWMYWIGVFTAGMTAFYVFRALFLAFFGDYRGDHHRARIAASRMTTVPLGRCSRHLLSLGGGLLQRPRTVLGAACSRCAEGAARSGAGVHFGRGGPGGHRSRVRLLLASAPRFADSLAAAFGGALPLVYNKYFVDEFYDATVVNPIMEGSRSVPLARRRRRHHRRHGQRRRHARRRRWAACCGSRNPATSAVMPPGSWGAPCLSSSISACGGAR